MKIKYNDYVHVIEKDGVCKVVVTTTVGGGAGGPLYLASSFDLDKLLLKIIEEDPKLFRKTIWKPIADKYPYPLGGKCCSLAKGKKSAHSNYLLPPPPPPTPPGSRIIRDTPPPLPPKR